MSSLRTGLLATRWRSAGGQSDHRRAAGAHFVSSSSAGSGRCSSWGEIFGDEVTAAATIDRFVDPAEILVLKRRQLPPEDFDRARATGRT